MVELARYIKGATKRHANTESVEEALRKVNVSMADLVAINTAKDKSGHAKIDVASYKALKAKFFSKGVGSITSEAEAIKNQSIEIHTNAQSLTIKPAGPNFHVKREKSSGGEVSHDYYVMESIEEAGSGGSMKIDSVQSMFLATERWILKKLEQLPSSAPVAAQMVEMLSDLRKRVQPHFGKKGAEAVEVFIPAMNEVGFITPAPPLNTLGKKWNLYYDKYASQYRLPKEGLKMKESLDEMKTFAGAVVRPVKTRSARELLWSVEKNGKLLGSISKWKNTKTSSFP